MFKRMSVLFALHLIGAACIAIIILANTSVSSHNSISLGMIAQAIIGTAWMLFDKQASPRLVYLITNLGGVGLLIGSFGAMFGTIQADLGFALYAGLGGGSMQWWSGFVLWRQTPVQHPCTS